jgi:hypothetical protein
MHRTFVSPYHCGYTAFENRVTFGVIKMTEREGFLPVLRFPLSVSFHQFCTLIHSPTINRSFTVYTAEYYYDERMRWAEHVASTEHNISEYKIVVKKLNGRDN